MSLPPLARQTIHILTIDYLALTQNRSIKLFIFQFNNYYRYILITINIYDDKRQ